MACFIVPLTQAIATTAYRKHVEKKVQLEGEKCLSTFHTASADRSRLSRDKNFQLSTHLKTLELMLWGGSLMLVVDHIINGEVTWMYPFFTALESEGGGMVMLKEMLTVGLPMSLIVTAAWAAWCYLKERKAVKA